MYANGPTYYDTEDGRDLPEYISAGGGVVSGGGVLGGVSGSGGRGGRPERMT